MKLFAVPTSVTMAKYNVIFLVNSIVTCSLENLDAMKAYEMAVQLEATLVYPGNRWHILTKNYTINNMNSMNYGDRLKFAYQEYSNNPDVDNEEIFIQKV